jgi:hypothetical protein
MKETAAPSSQLTLSKKSHLLRSSVLSFLIAALFLCPQAYAEPQAGSQLNETFSVFDQALGQDFTHQNISSYAALTGNLISLLQYVQAAVNPLSPDEVEAKVPHYNRLEHFGGWQHGDPTHPCRDTRNAVLARDAESPGSVVYRDASQCAVASALWLDPYTNTQFNTTHSVQIDHVVPLKNAYLAGAYTWSHAKRCGYANFLHTNFHLLAVSGHENMSKGDKGPDGYLPPNPRFACQYLNIWMKIKTIWQLTLSANEAKAVFKALTDNHCAASDVFMGEAELIDDRAAAEQPPEACVNLAASTPDQPSEVPPTN